MNQLFEIQAATLSARTRLSDAAIGTQAEAGKIQVVRVTYPKGSKGVVEPISAWMPVAEVAAYLGSMQ